MSISYRLSDIYNLQMGKTPSRDNEAYWKEGEYEWISIADLSKCEKYISQTKEKISKKAVEASGIHIIPAETVIMSFKLSIGKVAITQKALFSNEAIMAFIDKKVVSISPQYAYYLFSAQKWDAGTNRAVMGSTLNKATLSQYRVLIHDVQTQAEIVERLDKLSDLIKHRRQELQKLDDLVKSQFIEMFGNPEFNTHGLPLYKLGDLCNVGSSKRVYQDEQSTEGIPFLRISDLCNKIDGNENSCELFIPEKVYASLKVAGLVPVAGDILVTARGTLGRCYIIKESDRFYFQDGMITWLSELNEKVTSLYISHLFDSDGMKKQITSLQAGSTVAYLSIAMTKKLNIMLPPIEQQNEFARFVEQTDKSKDIYGLEAAA